MVQSPPKSLTLEEFLQLPETKPASEYIDGEIIQKPMPQGEHSTLQTELPTAINAVVKSKRVGIRFGWLYILIGFLVAFAFALPLFLFVREIELEKSRELSD